MNKLTDTLRRVVPAFLHLTAGAAAAFALEDFLVPSTILDGGVVGVSMIVGQLTRLPLSILTFVLNLPLLIIGAKNLGRRFFLSAIYSLALFSVMLRVFEEFANATTDPILAVV